MGFVVDLLQRVCQTNVGSVRGHSRQRGELPRNAAGFDIERDRQPPSQLSLVGEAEGPVVDHLGWDAVLCSQCLEDIMRVEPVPGRVRKPRLWEMD
ncbi:hypothetical protein D3C71_1777340 [compost metagenome]